VADDEPLVLGDPLILDAPTTPSHEVINKPRDMPIPRC
jgi:hypothetical protein